jgi:cell wall-associated NlpC family hydrolase
MSAKTKELISEARKWLGTKYRYGGHSKDGTDCSGMVMELYQQVYGLKLPRSSAQQCAYCRHVELNQIQAGDLMFFDTTKQHRGISHVGLYIGNGEMIHASSRGVIISMIDEPYYNARYRASGRVPLLADVGVTAKPYSKNANGVQPPRPTSDSALDELLTTKIDSIYSSMMD